MSMNLSLRDLESQLEQLTPRGLSDEGRDRCHATIDSLVGVMNEGGASSGGGYPRLAATAAAVVALGTGIGGGWYLGVTPASSPQVGLVQDRQSAPGFDRLDHEAWLITEEAPDVYVTENGEIREIFREVEVTKEIVKHRESGVVVTVETTDHHLVDSEKSEF